MEIFGLKLRPLFWKPRSRDRTSRSHSVMAGIYQNAIFNQWGSPEIQISISHADTDRKPDSLKVRIPPPEEALDVVLIYKARNRIFFFKKKRLLFHFRWSDYGERYFRLTSFEEKSPVSFRLGLGSFIKRIIYE